MFMVGVVTLLVAALTPASASVASAPAGSGLTGALARADHALSTHPAAIRAASGEAYTVYRSVVDASGAAHVRYNRTYHGLRVYGGDFVIHTNADGAFAGASVGLVRPLTL